MNRVSVIILNWNRKKDVSETLLRIRKQTVKPFETIVVDNASTDGSIPYIKKHFPEVKIVALPKNYALEGMNYGMKAGRGDYFIHLASDAIPANDLIQKHMEKFKNNPSLGMSCPVTYELKTKKFQGPNRSIEGDNTKGYEVTYFDGNGICLKREVYKKTDGYSKDYFICLEELEWAVRILKAGFEIKCFTDIKVYNSKAENGSQRKHYGFYYSRNWIWFYVKYLPIKEIINFILLHSHSFSVKTGKNGSMWKGDSIKGIVMGLLGTPKFILNRQVLPQKIINRLKLDLFQNSKHLYVKS